MKVLTPMIKARYCPIEVIELMPRTLLDCKVVSIAVIDTIQDASPNRAQRIQYLLNTSQYFVMLFTCTTDILSLPNVNRCKQTNYPSTMGGQQTHLP